MQSFELNSSQKQFIQSFTKLLEYPCSKTRKTRTIIQPDLKDLFLVLEPSAVRREGRTTAFYTIIQNLYLLREKEPLDFAIRYTRWQKEAYFQQFILIQCLSSIEDLVNCIRKEILLLYFREAAENYTIHYVVPKYHIDDMKTMGQRCLQEYHKIMDNFLIVKKSDSFIDLDISYLSQDDIVIFSPSLISEHCQLRKRLELKMNDERVHYIDEIDKIES